MDIAVEPTITADYRAGQRERLTGLLVVECQRGAADKTAALQ